MAGTLSVIPVVLVASACCSKDGPGPLVPGGGTPLGLSSDDIRPDAIIIERLIEDGQAIPPRIVCNADISIGQPDPSGVDKVTDSTLGQIDRSRLEEFRASAEVKALELIKAKVGANSTTKVSAKLDNIHRFEISTASLSYRLCAKKRNPICTNEINLSTDKNRRSIVTSALVADVVYQFDSAQGGSGDVGVNLEEVKAELGAGYKVEAGNKIRGAALTISYTSLKQGDPVSDADRFIWPDAMCMDYKLPIAPAVTASPSSAPVAPASSTP